MVSFVGGYCNSNAEIFYGPRIDHETLRVLYEKEYAPQTSELRDYT